MSWWNSIVFQNLKLETWMWWCDVEGLNHDPRVVITDQVRLYHDNHEGGGVYFHYITFSNLEESLKTNFAGRNLLQPTQLQMIWSLNFLMAITLLLIIVSNVWNFYDNLDAILYIKRSKWSNMSRANAVFYLNKNTLFTGISHIAARDAVYHLWTTCYFPF